MELFSARWRFSEDKLGMDADAGSGGEGGWSESPWLSCCETSSVLRLTVSFMRCDGMSSVVLETTEGKRDGTVSPAEMAVQLWLGIDLLWLAVDVVHKLV